jgi:hypothetical protein
MLGKFSILQNSYEAIIQSKGPIYDFLPFDSIPPQLFVPKYP